MSILDATIGWFLAQMADIVFNVVAWITAQIGHLLDFVIREMVLGMADLVNSIPAIENLWQIFRDLGNIAFIGVLLYIAIRTILDIGNSFNTKQTLVRLVIVALLVNFSLFATKVIVDTSNVVALQFYNSIQVEGCSQADGCNISHFFADATNISSVQSAESIEQEEAVQAANSVEFRIFLVRVLGIIFLLTTAFVMGAMAFLLVIRFAVLVLLMIASPLAFIAFILPSSKLGKQWWDKLLSQSFFAPVMFAMLYVVANLAAGLESGVAGGNTDLMAALLNPEGENIGVVLVFILMIALMVAVLVVAKQMGAAGASKAIEIGKNAKSWGQTKVVGGTARMTIGKAGQLADKKLKKSRFAQSYYGDKFRQATTKKAAEAKFGTGASAASIAEDKKDAESRLETFDKRERVKERVENADTVAEKIRHLSKLSSREKMKLGSSYIKKNAHLLSENDMKEVDKNDDFSDSNKQKIRENRYRPSSEGNEMRKAAQAAVAAINNNDTQAQENALGEIRASLNAMSENEIKNDIDINIETNDPEERDRNQQIIEAMNADQFDKFRKNKTRSEKQKLDRMRLKKLTDAIANNNVGTYLSNEKEEDIGKLLKLADPNVRTNDKVLDYVSPKVLEELKNLKSGEKNVIRNAIVQKATTPERASSNDNQRAADWLEYGPGNATF